MAKKPRSEKQKRNDQKFLEAAKKVRWVKGDPRAVAAGKKGGKRLPKLKALMEALLGAEEGTDPENTPLAKIITSLIKETGNQKIGAQRVAAAKELLDRTFGRVRDSKEMEESEVSAKQIITGFTIKRKE